MSQESFTCRVIGIPQTQGSSRGFVVKGRAVITSANKKLKPWRDTMTCAFVEALDKQPWATPLFTGPVHVEIDIILPRLKTMPKTAKGAYRWPTGKSDLDKHLRAVGDSLTDSQTVRDDGLICAWTAKKRYAEIGESPGLSLTVKEIIR